MKNFLINNPRLLKLFTFYTVSHNSMLGYYLEKVYETKQIESVVKKVFFFRRTAEKEMNRLDEIEKQRIAESMAAFELNE